MLELLFSIISQMFFISSIHSASFAPPLSKEEEEDCLRRLALKDPQARNTLIERNLRLVAHVAKKYENDKDLTEDLISIGTIGLIKAIDSYKGDHQTKLATYAARCIDNEILMHLRQKKKTALDVSLNESIGVDKDGSDILLEDIIPANQKDVEDIVSLNEDLLKLEQHLHVLTKREKEIIFMRYGIHGYHEHTQKQIASLFNISRSYVSRIEKRALVKLYKAFFNE